MVTRSRQREFDHAKAQAEGERDRLLKEIAGLDPVNDADDVAMLRAQVDVLNKFLDDWPDCLMTPEEAWG